MSTGEEVDVVPGVIVGDGVLVLGARVVSKHIYLNTSFAFTEHSPNTSTNGSLLPITLLNIILSEHCSFWGTNTDPVIFVGLREYFTRKVSVYTSPVSLQWIITVALLGVSPVHSNIICNIIFIMIKQQ